MLPIFSVVMPVYNVERFVADAVRSVLAQTFHDFELIIVDDDGADRSIDICRGFNDSRIRIISQPNLGLAGARNTGIANARGRYVAFLDADDRWNPEKLALHFIHLEASPDIDVSFSGSRFIDQKGRPLRMAMRPRLRHIDAAHILMRNPVGNGSSPVIRRRSLERVGFLHPNRMGRVCWFDESLRQSEDIEMWLRLAARHGLRFEGIAGLLTDYRLSAAGLSANIARQFESWQNVIEKVRAYAPELIERHGRMAKAFQLRYLARRAIQLGDGSFAASLLREALQTHPGMLFIEPRRTIMTVSAGLLLRLMPRHAFTAALMRPTSA